MLCVYCCCTLLLFLYSECQEVGISLDLTEEFGSQGNMQLHGVCMYLVCSVVCIVVYVLCVVACVLCVVY